MNPRAVRSFLTSKFGLFVVFVFVLFTGLFVYGQRQVSDRESARASRGTKKVDLGQMGRPLSQGLEDGIPQRADANGDHKSGLVAFRPATLTKTEAKPVRERPADEKPRKVRYRTLLAAYDAQPVAQQTADATPPHRFIPFGTLLKCKLVNTVDSANLETPVIAVLLEDVWQNGQRVIPANTLVHGTAKAGRLRDRVTASGTWRFVWQDGRELAFRGVALDREYEHAVDGYGITDGSAGMKGRVLATDDLQELKIMASAALSGFARGTQDRTHTLLGNTVTGSVSNGAREGVAEVFDMYAHRTLREVERNGYFVRVPAGKEFYVYVSESVDPAKARIGGAKVESPSAEPAAPTAPPPSLPPDEKQKG
jgi:hypothetical protein